MLDDGMQVPICEKAALEAPEWGWPSRRREEHLGLVGASGLKRSEPRRGHETAQFTLWVVMPLVITVIHFHLVSTS